VPRAGCNSGIDQNTPDRPAPASRRLTTKQVLRVGCFGGALKRGIRLCLLARRYLRYPEYQNSNGRKERRHPPGDA
jgi:hypothetical protein